MSYSISIRAADKAAAKAQVAEKVPQIVHAQPVHAADQEAIVANANAVIDLLPDAKEGFEISGNLSGYLTGEWDNGQMTSLVQVSVGANIGWVRKVD